MLKIGKKLLETYFDVSRSQCDNTFFGRYDNTFSYQCDKQVLSLYNFPEGNSLAATEFVRLLEVSGSVAAKQTNGTRENTQSLGSNSRV